MCTTGRHAPESAPVERPWARPMLSLVAALGLLTSAAFIQGHVQAQTGVPASDAVDITKLGPQVGATVPDFTLTDQRGQPRTLASLMGPNGLVLAFNRSADW
jgi:cytochrome oxidase Cu insertion factor (SCO1/SenC/PrrC family)